MTSQTAGQPETSRSVVVDASAIVALLIDPGSSGDRVASWVEGRQMHAPSHLHVEVTNVVRRRANAGALSRTEAALAFADLWKLAVVLWPLEVLAERTWELGGALSAYDAAYVALAERLGAPLITLDRRLASTPGPTCDFAVP